MLNACANHNLSMVVSFYPAKGVEDTSNQAAIHQSPRSQRDASAMLRSLIRAATLLNPTNWSLRRWPVLAR